MMFELFPFPLFFFVIYYFTVCLFRSISLYQVYHATQTLKSHIFKNITNQILSGAKYHVYHDDHELNQNR